jgi:hypothetical protein
MKGLCVVPGDERADSKAFKVTGLSAPPLFLYGCVNGAACCVLCSWVTWMNVKGVQLQLLKHSFSDAVM